MTDIVLTPSEILQGALVGVLRQSRAMQNGWKPAAGATEDRHWQIHIAGALGEVAVAKYLGVYWSGVGELGQTDVGGTTGHDVRCRAGATDELPIKADDPNDRRFYLVTGGYGVYKFRGWFMAGDGKREEWLVKCADGRNLYFVPQGELHHD